MRIASAHKVNTTSKHIFLLTSAFTLALTIFLTHIYPPNGQAVYDMVMNTASGYSDRSFLAHTPEQVSMLLDCD